MSLNVHLELSIDTGGPEPHRVEFFSGNITHNLNEMADAAGIYKALWHPDEVGITVASDLITPLTSGLEKMRSEPEQMRQHNPPNGWGTYEGLMRFVDEYLEACVAHPKADVRTCG